VDDSRRGRGGTRVTVRLQSKNDDMWRGTTMRLGATYDSSLGWGITYASPGKARLGIPQQDSGGTDND
jgi:hypothetical protein